MVASTRGGGYGSGFGSGFSVEPIDKRIREFITYEITRGILDATPMIFSTIKEGIMEPSDDRVGAFRTEIIVGQLGAQVLSFREFKACGALDFFEKKDPIASR